MSAVTSRPVDPDAPEDARPPPHEVPAPRHLPELDGLRGLAVLAVLAYHLVGQLPATTLAGKIAALPVNAGWMGVDLFFVLSGFLITRILLFARDESKAPLLNFWRNRALRIFPLYFAVLGLAGALGVPVSWHYWTYTANWWQASQPAELTSALSHLWSLCVEEQFYLVWPLVVLYAPRPTIRGVALALALLAPAARIALWALDAAPQL
ncbi:MAG: acyltransferase family protein, partial [Myxococcales bacterium]